MEYQDITPNPESTNSKVGIANLVFAIVIIGLAFVGGKLFLDNLPATEATSESNTQAEQQAESGEDAREVGATIGEKVAQLILVNEDEVPTVATIVNVNDLQVDNPGFYGAAKNGDKLVVYSDKALIYREEENKIINVLPVERVASE